MSEDSSIDGSGRVLSLTSDSESTRSMPLVSEWRGLDNGNV